MPTLDQVGERSGARPETKRATSLLDEFICGPRIAYFSMEIALRNEIPTYAGGLGVLAGDTVRSCADLGVPLVVVSLVSRAGYFRQEIDAEGRQIEYPASWEPSRWAIPLEARIAVPIDTIWYNGPSGDSWTLQRSGCSRARMFST